MRSYSETIKYLDHFVDYEQIGFDGIKKDLDPGKLRKVLRRLGDPHRDYSSVHVAGTKGKGSICAFTSSILRSSGFRVGLYTSPHLVTPAERVQVNGRMMPRADMVRVVGRLREILGPGASGKYTFFEVYTLMAMLYFSMKKVDLAVFETGMGGRLDATNVIDAKVCALAPVSYDHTRVLGKTIEKIAGEKAAIIKRGARCVSSPQKSAALRVIRERCRVAGAPLSVVGKDVTYRVESSDAGGSSFSVRTGGGRYENCRTRLPGCFQVANCATAVSICEKALKKKDIDEKKFKRGIERAFIPGRMEILSRGPLFVIDGAQNGESAKELKRSVERIFEYDRLILLLGISKDKDIRKVCDELTPLADEIVLTKASVTRAADPHLVRGYIKGRRVRITADVKEALGQAFRLAKKNDLILATGSFFVIGEVRQLMLNKQKNRSRI